MRVNALVGLGTVSLGGLYTLDGLVLGESSLVFGVVGVVFLVAGVGFILGWQEPKEDTGEKVLPPALSWYLLALALTLTAAIRAAEQIGFVTV